MTTTKKSSKSSDKKRQINVPDLKSKKDVKGGGDVKGKTIRIRIAATNNS